MLLIALVPMAGAAVHAADPPLVPLRAPAPQTMPGGPLGDAVRVGLSIVNATPQNARSYVGNALNCASCHLNGGTVAGAAPFVGLTGVFPEYVARSGKVETLADRINDCFMRSMNGKPLPQDGAEMTALLAYIAWLSQGVPTGASVQGRGFVDLPPTVRAPDPARGKSLYAAQCAACHGPEGAGLVGAGGAYAMPPLWGPKSFNDGAGMARIGIAAAFVKAKMPLGRPGTLADVDAYDLAAFFTREPRPDFAGKAKDWPKGDKPVDARY